MSIHHPAASDKEFHSNLHRQAIHLTDINILDLTTASLRLHNTAYNPNDTYCTFDKRMLFHILLHHTVAPFQSLTHIKTAFI